MLTGVVMRLMLAHRLEQCWHCGESIRLLPLGFDSGLDVGRVCWFSPLLREVFPSHYKPIQLWFNLL